MILYLFNRKGGIVATGEYDEVSNHMTVLKGSVINSKCTIVRGSRKRNSIYQKYVVDGILEQDVEFSSPSTAATFVSGMSMNGNMRWRDADRKSLLSIKEKDSRK